MPDFFKEYCDLYYNNSEIDKENVKIKRFTMIEELLISVFSMESAQIVSQVHRKGNVLTRLNGFTLEYLENFQGHAYVIFYDEIICCYFKSGGIDVVEEKFYNLKEKLQRLQLLEILN